MFTTLVAGLATPGMRSLYDNPTEILQTSALIQVSPTQVPLVQVTPSPSHNIHAAHLKRASDVGQAVLISNGITLAPSSTLKDAFGNVVCGFWQGYENSNFVEIVNTCSNDQTCATSGTLFGCSGGTWDFVVQTACSNLDWNVGDGTYHYTAGMLLCNKLEGVTAWSICQTVHMSGATSYRCVDNTQSSHIWLLEPTEVWSGFAGNTLTFTPPISTSAGYIPADPQTTLPYVIPSNAKEEQLSAIGFGTSGCMNAIVDECGVTPELLHEVYLSPDGAGTFCDFISNTTCPGLCIEGVGPIDRLDWTLSHCASPGWNETIYASQWIDYPMLTELAIDSFFPWQWRLQYNESRFNATTQPVKLPTCPSGVSQLIGFAVTNIVVLVLSLIVGHRRVVQAVTCGYMGTKGSRTWPLMIFVGVFLNVGANTINALLTQKTPGFEEVDFRELLLLWSSRPRASWWIILVAIWYGEQKFYTAAAVAALGTEVALQGMGSYYLGRTVNYGRVSGFYKAHRLDHIPHANDVLMMYAGAMLWSITAGFALGYAVWTLTPVGRVVVSGLKTAGKAIESFYNKLSKMVRSHDEKGAYAAAEQLDETRGNATLARPENDDGIGVIDVRRTLLYGGYQEQHRTFGLPRKEDITTKRVAVQEVSQGLDKTSAGHNKDHSLIRLEKEMGFDGNLRRSFKIIVFLMILPWIGQWLFWAGFLRMADNRFCPPKLWTNVGIWALFSIVSNFFGAGA